MKHFYKIFIAAAMLISAHSATAQSTGALKGISYGGIMLTNDLMYSSDFITLSQRQTFGSARSMAMGNAFTSLGGDVASMGINPAGIGMYRSNHFSITPLVTTSNATTANTSNWNGTRATNFGIANTGFVLNLFESVVDAGAISASFGIGVNRVADFNQKYSYSTLSKYNASTPDVLMPTIADLFARQLGDENIFPNSEGELSYGNPFYWPAQLGYNGYMISALSDGDGEYWTPDAIGANASIGHGVEVETSGSITEYQFSYGFNFANILYLGATMGVESVNHQKTLIYREEYYYNDGSPQTSTGDAISTYLDHATIYQYVKTSGAGVNLKVGAIVRPIESLRIGVAYHSPTAYSLERVYSGEIESTMSDYSYYHDSTPEMIDVGEDSWEFSSPNRLLAGGSFTLGHILILSFDYERAWYQSMRVSNVPYGSLFSTYNYNSELYNSLQATNTYRAGLEIKPTAGFALRAGAGMSSSPIVDAAHFNSAPTPTSSHFLSGGVGFIFPGGVSIDLAYQNHFQNYSSYALFYGKDIESDSYITTSGTYNTNIRNHNIVASVGLKF